MSSMVRSCCFTASRCRCIMVTWWGGAPAAPLASAPSISRSQLCVCDTLCAPKHRGYSTAPSCCLTTATQTVSEKRNCVMVAWCGSAPTQQMGSIARRAMRQHAPVGQQLDQAQVQPLGGEEEALAHKVVVRQPRRRAFGRALRQHPPLLVKVRRQFCVLLKGKATLLHDIPAHASTRISTNSTRGMGSLPTMLRTFA